MNTLLMYIDQKGENILYILNLSSFPFINLLILKDVYSYSLLKMDNEKFF